jgi:hypothetical protein
MATRNALQAEKAAYHSSLLQLKEQHTKDLRDLAEVNMKSVLESESKIRSLTLEFDELRASSQLVSDLKREVQDVEERIHRAAEKAREEERHRSQRTIQEVREQCQVLLKEAEETLQSRQRNVDDYHQVPPCPLLFLPDQTSGEAGPAEAAPRGDDPTLAARAGEGRKTECRPREGAPPPTGECCPPPSSSLSLPSLVPQREGEAAARDCHTATARREGGG